MTQHIATYTDPITKEELSVPEVWLIPPKGTPSRFRLEGGAEVIIRFPHPTWNYYPELKAVAEELSGRRWKGTWGGIQNTLLRHQDESGRDDFYVEVVKQVWECEPKSIAKHIGELQETIHKRNIQIKDLRKQKRTS